MDKHIKAVDLVYRGNFKNLKTLNQIRKSLYAKMSPYNCFIIVVKTEFDKEFALFVPNSFKQTDEMKTQKLLGWYLINDEELVTCTTLGNSLF